MIKNNFFLTTFQGIFIMTLSFDVQTKINFFESVKRNDQSPVRRDRFMLYPVAPFIGAACASLTVIKQVCVIANEVFSAVRHPRQALSLPGSILWLVPTAFSALNELFQDIFGLYANPAEYAEARIRALTLGSSDGIIRVVVGKVGLEDGPEKADAAIGSESALKQARESGRDVGYQAGLQAARDEAAAQLRGDVSQLEEALARLEKVNETARQERAEAASLLQSKLLELQEAQAKIEAAETQNKLLGDENASLSQTAEEHRSTEQRLVRVLADYRVVCQERGRLERKNEGLERAKRTQMEYVRTLEQRLATQPNSPHKENACSGNIRDQANSVRFLFNAQN